MAEVDWQGLWKILQMHPGTPLQQSQMPLTGFLGPQRTASGRPATWMNMGVNLGGLEWLIPLLTPNQPPELLKRLLSELPLEPEERRQIEENAIQFALEYEKVHPGTFAKYPTQREAEVGAMSPSKNFIVRDLPHPRPQYPGRE